MLARLLVISALLVIGFAERPTGQAPSDEPRLPSPADTPSPSEALIRQAYALYASGSYRESAATWQTVATRETLIADLARRESVRALIAAGDLEGTLTGLRALGATVPADLLLLAGDSCRRVRALECAAGFYRRAREAAGPSPARDRAALALASTLEEDEQPRDALTVYRDLQLTFRLATTFDTADAAARRLSTRLGSAVPLTETAYDAIVDRLVDVAAFRRAVDVQVEWLAKIPDSLRKVNIEAAIVEHLYALRANDEARARAAAFLETYPESVVTHDVIITLFRLDVREGRTADAEKRGRAILGGQVPGAQLDDRQSAARLLAEYFLSIGDPTKALAVFDELYTMTVPRRARIDVLWRTAIAALRAGNRTRAVTELQRVLRLQPDSETERATSFWLAYAQDVPGSETLAKTRWAAIASRYPFSYYGVRAATRTGAPPPEPSLAFPSLVLSPVVRAHPAYQAAALLSRAGLAAEAAVYARRLNTAFRRDAGVALLAARASEAVGDHTSASRLMSSYFGPYLERPATGLPDDFWSLAYPSAYWPEVSAAGARHKVDPLLMLGLARQESHFDRTARSVVGAVGLFQVMPYTAAELDPTFSTPVAMERLTQADVSAELAARLISSLRARYQGALAPTIASYNADKERVQVWWDAAKGLPEELFIDSIPYRETRAYVRQVLANYAMYQYSARSASPKR